MLGLTPAAIGLGLFVTPVAIASLQDLRRGRVHDGVAIALALSGFAFSLVFDPLSQTAKSLLPMIVALLALATIYRFKRAWLRKIFTQIGAADVGLAIALLVWLTVNELVECLLIAALLALISFGVNRQKGQPFVPFMAMGLIIFSVTPRITPGEPGLLLRCINQLGGL